jgi:hypothetical protein
LHSLVLEAHVSVCDPGGPLAQQNCAGPVHVIAIPQATLQGGAAASTGLASGTEYASGAEYTSGAMTDVSIADAASSAAASSGGGIPESTCDIASSPAPPESAAPPLNRSEGPLPPHAAGAMTSNDTTDETRTLLTTRLPTNL